MQLSSKFLHMLLVGVKKAANQRVSFIDLGADWLYPEDRKLDRPWMLASAVVQRRFPQIITSHIKVHLVFQLLKWAFRSVLERVSSVCNVQPFAGSL